MGMSDSIILIISVLASFLVTLFALPYWIKKAGQIGLMWDDMNKFIPRKVAGSGGIMVVLGFVMGVLIFVAYEVFYLKVSNSFLIEIFAMLVSVIFLAGIGLVDDMFGWQKGGLSIKSRLFLVLMAAVPLIVINAGKSVVSLPFFGQIELGVVYPLILVPIGIVGATTTFNFLAGFNGLEAGQGMIMLSALSIVAFFTGSPWISIAALCMVFALAAFMIFNFFPARVFPGDALTYSVGGLIAIISIIGNFERIALFFFLPYVIETFLKLRGKLKKQSFGLPKKDGSLELRYNKLYGLEHTAIFFMQKLNIKPTEKRVVYLIWTAQITLIILGLLIFREGIFV